MKIFSLVVAFPSHIRWDSPNIFFYPTLQEAEEKAKECVYLYGEEEDMLQTIITEVDVETLLSKTLVHKRIHILDDDSED